MPLFTKSIDQITANDITELINNQVLENKQLEYKEVLPGNTDDEKKEFLADVSSFANATGGYLIYGIRELKQEQKIELAGLKNIDADKEVTRLEEIIRNGIAPRIRVNIGIVSVTGTDVVIVLHIPRSWSAPHMMTFKNSSRFYSRHSKGKFQLDVHELRSAFNSLESIYQKSKQFRFDRLNAIEGDEAPVNLPFNAPKIILHLIPLNAFDPAISYDLKSIPDPRNHLEPLYSAVQGYRHNFDGLVAYGSFRQNIGGSYTQFFRNGIIESVDITILNNQEKLIPSGIHEKEICNGVTRYLSLYKSLGIAPPLQLALSFLNVRGFEMGTRRRTAYYSHDTNVTINKDNLILPELLVENFAEHPVKILKPLFDVVWNACGWERSINYDPNGNWIGDPLNDQ
jgi:hypothetical protein